MAHPNFRIGKKYFLFVFIAVVLIFILFTCHAFQNLNEDRKLILPSPRELAADDKAMLPPSVLAHSSINKIFRAKGRNNISLLYYNDSLNLLLYRIPVTSKSALGDLLHTSDEHIDWTNFLSYQILAYGLPYQLRVALEETKPAEQLLLSIEGDSLFSSLRDSTYYASLYCKTMGLRYQSKGHVDLHWDATERPWSDDTRLSEMLMIKHDSEVRLYLLSALKGKMLTDRTMLYKLIVQGG